MQSLGLDVRVLDEDGAEIDLKMTFDDDIQPQGPLEFADENTADTTSYGEDAMGEAGYGTAEYGKDTELIENDGAAPQMPAEEADELDFSLPDDAADFTGEDEF